VNPQSPVDVGHLLDTGRWTRYQKWLVALVALTIVFDGIDNQLLGIVIPTVMREWGVPRSDFSSVVSLGYAGMMMGGAAAGLAGDRVGRQTALLGSMVVFGVMTLAAAMADSTAMLGALRLLAGIGLGGAMPNAAALAAEYVPANRRPIAVTIAIVCVPLGGTLAGLLGIRALPLLGWRTLFLVGGVVPIVAAVALRWVLPESPRWLARRPARWGELVTVMRRMGHGVAPDSRFVDSGDRSVGRASIGSLFAPDLRRDTIALWAAFFSCLLGVYMGFSWLTSLLTGAGFDAGTANTGITAFNLGGVVGALLGGLAISRFGSRAAMLTMTGVAVAGAAGLSAMTISPAVGVVPIIAMLTLTGSMINGVQTTMFALAAHVYPGSVRATGVGTAVAFGRTGAILTGYIGSWAIEYRGTESFFGVIAAAMVSTFVALALVRRHVPAWR
ncbi:MAG: MFS transporter, partial [Vicinamibacteria bacterium]|nr:MFS transporter [Vicinamibacteria bacterium]